jgi:hypothetical protein
MQTDPEVFTHATAYDIFNRMYDVLPTQPSTLMRDALANNLFLQPLRSLPVPTADKVYVPLIDASFGTPPPQKKPRSPQKANYTDHTDAFAPGSSWSGLPRMWRMVSSSGCSGPGTPEQTPPMKKMDTSTSTSTVDDTSIPSTWTAFPSNFDSNFTSVADRTRRSSVPFVPLCFK